MKHPFSEMNDLVQGYVESRRHIIEKIANLKADRELLHHELKIRLQEVTFPGWIQDWIDEYLTGEIQGRLANLERLIEQLRHLNLEADQDQILLEAERVAKRDGSVGLDLTTWISMRNSISYAIYEMSKYTEYEDKEEIIREARSYDKKRIQPIDWMDRVPVQGPEEEIVRRLSEEVKEGSDVTISLELFSRRQREVVQMWIGGMSYSKIAEELGISKDSVAQHMDLARRKARNRVEEGGIQLGLALDL